METDSPRFQKAKKLFIHINFYFKIGWIAGACQLTIFLITPNQGPTQLPRSSMKTILITGASSGLGRALALEYAAQFASSLDLIQTPKLTLILTARRLAELISLKQDIFSLFHNSIVVHVAILDVTDYDSVFTTLDSLAKLVETIDIVIVNAGIGHTFKLVGSQECFNNQRSVIETNLIGAMAVCNWSISHFREFPSKKDGFQLVGMSSVTEVVGLPTSAAYCASKSALKTYFESIQVETYYENISVTILSPGYIDTPMSQNLKNKKYFMISDQEGARIMREYIEEKRSHVYVPSWPWYFISILLTYAPTWLIAMASTRTIKQAQKVK